MALIEKLLRAARAALLGAVLLTAFVRPALSEEQSNLDILFEQLKMADAEQGRLLEMAIVREWSNSGSPMMNLLLARGQQRIARQQYESAIRFLSVLTENAPDFAEGWNARATAYFLAGYDDLSLADIARTLALEPRHFGAISGLGIIMERRGQIHAALSAFEMVREIYPNRPGLAETIARLKLKASASTI